MTQIMSAPTNHDMLHDSNSLIEVLQQHRSELPDADAVLARHRAIHRELEFSHLLGEQILEAWRVALIRRWECEVAGQRLYKRIWRQLRDRFGVNSPQLQAIAPTKSAYGKTPAELLAELRRTHASVSLMQPLSSHIIESLEELAQICDDFAEALARTNELQTRRRSTTIEQQQAQHIYQRVRNETKYMLNEYLKEQC